MALGERIVGYDLSGTRSQKGSCDREIASLAGLLDARDLTSNIVDPARRRTSTRRIAAIERIRSREARIHGFPLVRSGPIV
jgi:hypothetical protein